MARRNTTLQLVGSSFTLMELEGLIRSARDMQMPVDATVSVSHEERDRHTGYDYTLSVTSGVDARPARPTALSQREMIADFVAKEDDRL